MAFPLQVWCNCYAKIFCWWYMFESVVMKVIILLYRHFLLCNGKHLTFIRFELHHPLYFRIVTCGHCGHCKEPHCWFYIIWHAIDIEEEKTGLNTDPCGTVVCWALPCTTLGTYSYSTITVAITGSELRGDGIEKTTTISPDYHRSRPRPLLTKQLCGYLVLYQTGIGTWIRWHNFRLIS